MCSAVDCLSNYTLRDIGQLTTSQAAVDVFVSGTAVREYASWSAKVSGILLVELLWALALIGSVSIARTEARTSRLKHPSFHSLSTHIVQVARVSRNGGPFV